MKIIPLQDLVGHTINRVFIESWDNNSTTPPIPISVGIDIDGRYVCILTCKGDGGIRIRRWMPSELEIGSHIIELVELKEMVIDSVIATVNSIIITTPKYILDITNMDDTLKVKVKIRS